MDIKQWTLNLKAIKSQRNHSFCLNVFLGALLSLALFNNLLLRNNHDVKLIPCNLSKEVVVGPRGVDLNYLSAWTNDMTSLKLSFTPSLIEQQQRRLLQHISPSFYGRFKEHLAEESEFVKHNDITSRIFIKTIRPIENKPRSVKVIGQLEIDYGTEKYMTKQVSYQIDYEQSINGLLVTNFKEVDSDEPNADDLGGM